ncbi:MAG: tetratricopeptide repeat protein, partial [Acidobacteriota bacterium]
MERKGLVAFLLLASAGWGLARAADEPARLEVGSAITREIHEGEVQPYLLTLKAGDYVHIEVVQEGVDVKVALRDPAGAMLQEADTPMGPYSSEVVEFVAETGGDHRVEVRPFVWQGTYRVTLEDLHPATPEDRLRVEAERAVQEGHDNLDRALRSVELWRELGDRQGEARALVFLGMCQSKTRHYQEGLASCDQALALHRSSGDRQGIAASLLCIARANRFLGNRDRALAASREAISLFQELHQPERVAVALMGAGLTFERFEEFGEAVSAYGQALAISRSAKDPSLETDVLRNLGQLHVNLGQPRPALDELRAALDLARGTDKEADLLLSLGALYRDFGSPREALKHFAAALEIFKASGQSEKRSAALNNLGGLLLKLGAPQEARELLLQALPLSVDPRDRATVLLGIGKAEDQLGNLEKAEARLDEALKLQQGAADRAGEAETLRVRGFLLLKLGQPAPAREAFVQAIGLMEQLGRRSFQAAARRGLGLAEAGLGNMDAARSVLEEARKQAEDMGNVSEQALDLAEAGRLEHEAGRLPEARARLESSLSLIESFQSEIGGEGLRTQHFAKIRETYERYVDVLMQTHLTQPGAGLLAEAFEAAERSRARSLLDVLTRARVDTHDSDPGLMERELQLRLELNARAAARMALPPGPARDAID